MGVNFSLLTLKPDFRWQSSEAHFESVRVYQLRTCTPAHSLSYSNFLFLTKSQTKVLGISKHA